MILLTGASGFLGKHLVSALKINKKIISIGRSNSDIIIDLKNQLPQLPSGINTVIHVAGKAHCVPNTARELQDFYEVNVLGTLNLLKALEISSIPQNFIFISSVAVYGLQSGNLINEESPLKATDPYGSSKIQSERIIIDWCSKHNVICTVFRLPLVAGVDPPGNLGAMIKAIRLGYFFTINEGQSRKSMVLAEDIGAFLSNATLVDGIFNLTDGIHPSVRDLSIVIASKLGKKRKPLNISLGVANILGMAGDIIGSKSPINSSKLRKLNSDLTFDDSKARRLLGWNPTGVLQGFKL